jgi:hypothetical protein
VILPNFIKTKIANQANYVFVGSCYLLCLQTVLISSTPQSLVCQLVLKLVMKFTNFLIVKKKQFLSVRYNIPLFDKMFKASLFKSNSNSLLNLQTETLNI